MDKNVEEALLRSWMDMALQIRGNRIVEGLSFNEIVICSMLYRSRNEGIDQITATDIGAYTGLLKSQLNKVLTDMEEKGLLERTRSNEDRRKVYIQLNEEQLSVYLNAHQKVMEIVGRVCKALGEEKAMTLAGLLTEAVAAVKQEN